MKSNNDKKTEVFVLLNSEHKQGFTIYYNNRMVLK